LGRLRPEHRNAAHKRQARVGLSSHVPGPRDNKEIAMSDLIERAKAALDGYTGQEIAESERLSFASSILADAEALKAADALIDHAQAAHDELALWFECANELERHGFEIGDTEAAMNALDRAITAYRKARGGE